MKYFFYLFTLFVSVFLISCGSNSSGGGGDVNIDRIPVGDYTDGFGYIDNNGKVVVNPQYTYATAFVDGLALVRTKGSSPKLGFIDKAGKVQLELSYQSATVFSEGIAFVSNKNEPPKAINEKGEVRFSVPNATNARAFQDGLAAIAVKAADGDEKWGFVDKDGKVKINPQYRSVGNFSNGKCAVANNDYKWGYIDKEGKIIINNQFNKAGEFKNGKAVVSSGGKFGVIDEKGNYIVNPQYKIIFPDGDQYVVFNEQTEKAGWVDETGKTTITTQFEAALPFYGNDLAPAMLNKSFGYINKEGTFKINPQFEEAYPFYNGVAVVKTGRSYGLINKEGKFIANPQFEEIPQRFLSLLIGDATALPNSYNSDLYLELK